MTNTEELFIRHGGTFPKGYEDFVERASKIKAIILDWDGVFNSGAKGDGHTSNYTETDSMGLNMLRLAYWMQNNEIPFLAIITGQNNSSAIQLAQRERFHAVYSGFLNKGLAFDHVLEQNGLKADDVAFVFDDILDIAIADKCGLRCQVKNGGSPVFDAFVEEYKMADYVTANPGSRYAVREVCELLMSMMGTYSEIIKERIEFSPLYKEYLAERNSREPRLYKMEDGVVEII